MIATTRQMLGNICVINPKFSHPNAYAKRKTCRRADVLKRHFFTYLMVIADPQTEIFLFAQRNFAAKTDVPKQIINAF